MSDDPESFGPLTPVEDKELESCAFKDDSLYDLEKTQKWYQRVVSNLMDGDPTRPRLVAERDMITRCLDLKRRKSEWGVASVVTLTDTFPKE